MRRFLLGFLLRQLLVVTSCHQKAEPQPAPELIGSWSLEFEQTFTYNADGTETSRTGEIRPTNPTSRQYAEGTVYFNSAPGGQPTTYSVLYLREGQVLLYYVGNTYRETIRELTAHALVLQHELRTPTTRTVTLTHFTH